MLDRIEQLEYDLSMLADMAPAGAVNYIRKAIGYDDYIREYAQEMCIRDRAASYRRRGGSHFHVPDRPSGI